MQGTDVRPRSDAAVTVEGLTFAYGAQRAVDGLSLRVPSRSVFGLIGPNGSGKSTLLSLLAGLRAPDAGSIHALGEAPSPRLRSRMGLLFQETSLDPLMTVRETLWLHGRLFGLPAAETRLRITEVLQTVGLSERAAHLTRTLSGGMKRRLELARSLLPSPQLLLLDEPTAGLDPESVQALWSHLREASDAGMTVIVATNDISEADTHCDNVAFIYEGRIASQGSPAELKLGLKRDGVWVEGDFSEDLIHQIAGWADVGRVTSAPPVLHVTVDSAASFVPRLFQTAGERITSIRLREATLEDAYFDTVGAPLTGGGETP